MSTTSHPTDQPTGQLITDEQSLEKIFRANYARLVADAKRRLGDSGASAAPRVVSKAFHQAWNERKRFHAMEELEAYLGANIQHGSARELSRIAGLHRMDHVGGPKEGKHDVTEMGVDEAWDRLQHTLSGGAPDAYRQRASTARHEAAEHMAQLGKERNWKPVVLVTALLAAAGVGVVYWVQKIGESRAVDHALAASDVRAYETGSGQQANVTLDDGTVVRLGPESKLTVPRRFGIGLRAVKIEGTANFDVTQTLDQPFDVRSGPPPVIIVARGTKFTVRRYKDDPGVVVHVGQGSVDMTVGEETRAVAQGAALAVDTTGAITVPSQEKVDEASTWVSGSVTVVGRTLRYALPQLKRWYGLDVKVPDARLLERQVFLRAPINSPREAITSIEQSGGLKFTYIGENMAFEDTVPSRPARGRR